MADGHLNKCKECTKSDVKVHRRENESVREYDRKRGNRRSYLDTKAYREKYPNKYKAHSYINNQVRKGLIEKPSICENCNIDVTGKGMHGHHDDYALFDIVRWLCAKCHHRWHAEHGEALNP